ncbi:hypothetical protein IGI04_023297 [Brassica rapa subsp. trilocularis]|uniref:Uncharacterized protein n=1 Tax=Brassica rapa subsp. trilocularis TaxID=1813537 RepID=A0ABQ7M3F3_BRACM|nr:hypothetical protein IGI04_023297 [Brassica rapa subsp. trilocularis]
MVDGKHTVVLDMSELWNRLQGFDPVAELQLGTIRLAKFCNIIGEDRDFANMFTRLQDYSYSTSRNWISDFLARTTRSFHRELHFVGYYILV